MNNKNSNFPSGEWLGFYNYSSIRNGKHRMDLHLTFANGVISGAGIDDVERFIIKGRYDSANAECYLTKSYIGAHDVFYRGFREGKGIWGIWEIGPAWRGGFQIWPRVAREGEKASTSFIAEAPVDTIATEPVTQRSYN